MGSEGHSAETVVEECQSWFDRIPVYSIASMTVSAHGGVCV